MAYSFPLPTTPINQVRKEKNIYSISILQIFIDKNILTIKQSLRYSTICINLTQPTGNNEQTTTDGYPLVLIPLGMGIIPGKKSKEAAGYQKAIDFLKGRELEIQEMSKAAKQKTDAD